MVIVRLQATRQFNERQVLKMASLNKEEIRTKLERYISEYQAKIELWQRVERITKKDGTDFQNFGKNFTNSKIETGLIHDRDLVVFDHKIINNRMEWIEDKISTDINFEDYVKIFARQPEENRIIREPIIKDYLYLTPDESMQLINRQIAIYQERITDYRRQLDLLDNAYDIITAKTKELFDTLKEVTGDLGMYHNSLYYALKEKIEKYPY